MRITGGKARGIILKSSNAKELRPAGGATREAVFSSLSNSIVGARVVDLFAGTGAYGLEALSRGAASVVFIEKQRLLAQLIRDNIELLCKSAQRDTTDCQVWIKDVLKLQNDPTCKADIVFVDAPYLLMRRESTRILEVALQCLVPTENARLVVEAPADFTWPDMPRLKELKRLGKEGKNRPMVGVFGRG